MGIQRKSSLGRTSMCKGPEVAACHVCSVNIKEASVAEVERLEAKGSGASHTGNMRP